MYIASHFCPTYRCNIFKERETVIVTDVENTKLGKLERVRQAPGFSLLAILFLA
jgi:hypothetical protein